jgi:hypothetical protein
LNHVHKITKALQSSLNIVNIQDLHRERLASNSAHQRNKLGVNAFEARPFSGELRLDVRASEQNSFQVHPSTLDIDPGFERCPKLREAIFPKLAFFLKFSNGSIVRRAFHQSQPTDVVIKSCEQVVPSSDQASTILEENQLELLLHPSISQLTKENLERHFSLGHGQNFGHFLFPDKDPIVPQ